VESEAVTARVTDRDTGGEDELRNLRNAQATCSCCARCGRKLAPDAPVWRERVFLGPGRPARRGVAAGVRHTIAPVCERCSKLSPRLVFGFLPEQPCVTCGRPVHDEDTMVARRWTVCCERCARAARVIAARHQRSDKRGTRTCATCGEVFEPTRSDAKFCSSAHRQQAYRRERALRISTPGQRAPDTLAVTGRAAGRTKQNPERVISGKVEDAVAGKAVSAVALARELSGKDRASGKQLIEAFKKRMTFVWQYADYAAREALITHLMNGA
jgi:hypothetical protein